MNQSVSFSQNWDIYLFALAGLMMCAYSAGCGERRAEGRIEFTGYPNLKLGFTTQNFILCVPVSLENEKRFIDYAAAKGFRWMELRDPDAALTAEECREIARYARQKGVEIGYANQRGLLDPDFGEVFARGLRNAKEFAGPRTYRALVSGQNFLDKKKVALTGEEVRRMAAIADESARAAREQGLRFVLENGGEPLRGDGAGDLGLADLFARTGEEVEWQFDTANFFNRVRYMPAKAEVEEFLRQRAGKLAYVHLKSIRDNQPQAALGEIPLGFERLLPFLAEHEVCYLAIELFAIGDKRQVYENMDRSLEYLRGRGIIR